jgi:hypothetical protein
VRGVSYTRFYIILIMIIVNIIKSGETVGSNWRERRARCPQSSEMNLRHSRSQLWQRQRTSALPRRWSSAIHYIVLYCRSLEFRKTVLAGCSRGRLTARAINISSAGYIRLPLLHMYIIYYNVCVVPYIIIMYIPNIYISTDTLLCGCAMWSGLYAVGFSSYIYFFF